MSPAPNWRTRQSSGTPAHVRVVVPGGALQVLDLRIIAQTGQHAAPRMDWLQNREALARGLGLNKCRVQSAASDQRDADLVRHRACELLSRQSPAAP